MHDHCRASGGSPLATGVSSWNGIRSQQKCRRHDRSRNLSCLIGIRRRDGRLQVSDEVVAAFLSFWFFFFLCEWLWKCEKVSRPTGPWLRIVVPTTRWFAVEIRSRAWYRRRDAYSDGVLRGLDYKGCSFSGQVGERSRKG